MKTKNHRKSYLVSLLSLLSISTIAFPSLTLARTIEGTALNHNTQSGSYSYSETSITENINEKLLELESRYEKLVRDV